MRSGSIQWTAAGKWLAFAGMGVVLSMGLAAALLQASQDMRIGLLLVVGGPIFLVFLAFGIKQSLAHWTELRANLHVWHFLWFLMFFSAFVWRVRDAASVEGQPLDAVASLRIGPEFIIGAFLLVQLALKRGDWFVSYRRGLMALILIFSAGCLLTTIWSVYPSWTFYKSAEYLLDGAVMAYILFRVHETEEFRNFLNWVWVLVAGELLWVWLQIPLWPSESFKPAAEGDAAGVRLNGVFPVVGYNAVGATGAVLATIAVARLLNVEGKTKDRAWYVLLLLFGIASMAASQTRGAMGGFAFALVILFLVNGRAKLGALMGLAAGLVLSVTSVGTYLSDFVLRQQSSEEIKTLTGRTDWWGVAWEVFLQHPLTGVGAYATAKFSAFAKFGTEIETLHSDYLELLVGSSFWGTVPFVLAILGTWWYLLRFARDKRLLPADRQLAMECVGVLAVMTVRSFVNVELTWHAPVFFLAALGGAEFLRRRYQAAPPSGLRPAFAPNRG